MVSGMDLVPGLGKPVMVVQYQPAANSHIWPPVLLEGEAVPVEVGVEADKEIAVVGPFEVVADGPRQLVPKNGDGQNIPDYTLRPRCSGGGRGSRGNCERSEWFPWQARVERRQVLNSLLASNYKI